MRRLLSWLGGWAAMLIVSTAIASAVLIAACLIYLAASYFRRGHILITAPPTREPVSVGKYPVDRRLEEIDTTISMIGRGATRANGKIHTLERDSETLLYILAESTALSILFNALPEPPALIENTVNADGETLSKCKEAADAYSKDVTRTLSDTQWAHEIRMISGNADANGEYFVRQIPVDERPADVDALDLRAYHIARIRCVHIAAFVDRERGEARDKYRHYLSRLHEMQDAIRLRNQNQQS